MLRYYNTLIGLQEIPDEVSLVINISNCPIHCKGCHAKMLWDDIGKPLTPEELNILVDSLLGDITCVCFMGGDMEPDAVNDLARHIRRNYPELKIGWYSGAETITVFTEYQNFDYLKFGPYIRKLGGLNSPKTNQRMYEVVGGCLRDITPRFW